MDKRYVESDWRRGWKDTKRTWGKWWFLLIDVAAGTIGLIHSPWLAVLIPILGFAAVWFAMTATAPVRQRDEVRERIDELEQGESQALLDLAEWRDIGVMLVNEPLANSDDFDGWLELYEEWHERVVNALGVLSEIRARLFKTQRLFSLLEYSEYSDSVNDRRARARSLLHAKLGQLEQDIELLRTEVH